MNDEDQNVNCFRLRSFGGIKHVAGTGCRANGTGVHARSGNGGSNSSGSNVAAAACYIDGPNSPSDAPAGTPNSIHTAPVGVEDPYNSPFNCPN